MIRPRLKVETRKKLKATTLNDNSFSDWDEIDVSAITAQTNIEVRRDSFRVTVPNINRRRDDGVVIFDSIERLNDIDANFSLDAARSINPFDNDDEFRIQAWNKGLSSPEIIVEGSIFDVDYESGDNGQEYSLAIANRTHELLHAKEPALFNIGSQNLTPAQMIVQLVDRANNKNTKSKQINAELAIGSVVSGEFVRTGGGYIWPVQKDGSTMKKPTYISKYLSLYQHVKKLASPDFTGDTAAGTYLYFVDKDNNVHFKPRSKDIISPDVEENLVANVRLDQNTDDVINAVILHAGQDPNGNGITAVVYDAKSAAEVGTRWKYKPITVVADRIQVEERKNGPTANPGKEIPDDSMYPDSYPWILQDPVLTFTGVERGTNPVGDAAIGFPNGPYSSSREVKNDTEYKNAIRNKARQEARIIGQELLNKYGKQLFECVVELEYGNNDFELSRFYNVKIPSRNYDGTTNVLNLRLVAINHNFSRDGWTTALTLREDFKDEL